MDDELQDEILVETIEDELPNQVSIEDEKVVVNESDLEDKTVINEFDNFNPIVTPIEKEEILIEEVIEQSDLGPDSLSNSFKELVSELRLPVKSPELMIVVPRAVSLDESLNKEHGDQEFKNRQKVQNLIIL